MADASVIEDLPLHIEGHELLVPGEQLPLPLETLRVVNPEPWELGEGYKWTVDISFAFSIERGNSHSYELDYAMNTVWQCQDDRYILKLRGELDEANDNKNADNWNIIGKYDSYFDPPDGEAFGSRNYWGRHMYAEEDQFADLNLRYFTGPYIGRDFLIRPRFKLSAESGLSYVSEDFINARVQEYPGATWNLELSSDFLGGDSSLYMDQLGVWNLSETSDMVINTSFGLSFPLLLGFEAAAEILLEYDSGSVEGVERMDETYALRLGYYW
ncbi:DUF481 domain-containing protein [Halioglobus japonicus]|nr:DUF481 domain-containing protein [Halioglobus japonicus]